MSSPARCTPIIVSLVTVGATASLASEGAFIASGREKLVNAGGGELTVKGRDGKIRSKDTLGGGNDPIPPRDREH